MRRNCGRRIEIRVDKLNRLIDTRSGEYAPGQGIEKAFRNFPGGGARDQRGINCLDRHPNGPFGQPVAH